MNHVPTIITNQEILSKPSLLPSAAPLRSPPTKRKYEHPLLDQTEFRKHDVINCVEQLNESFCPAGFSLKKCKTM